MLLKLVIMSLRGIANGDAVAISRKGTALFNKVSVPGDSHASLGMTECFARVINMFFQNKSTLMGCFNNSS